MTEKLSRKIITVMMTMEDYPKFKFHELGKTRVLVVGHGSKAL